MVLSREYLFYESLLKGSYIKGANTLEGIMRNQAQAAELVANATAMTVVFEPMTQGGRRLLPDVFFSAGKYAGAGLRTYVRATESDFDGGGVLTPIQTITEIASSAEAMEVITASPAAMAAVAGSIAAMRVVLASGIAMEKVSEGGSFTKAVADSIPAMTAVMENRVRLAEILASPAVMAVIAESIVAVTFIMDNAALRTQVFESETAVAAITGSAAAMTTILANTAYTATISSNGTVMTAVINSPEAVAAMAKSPQASLTAMLTHSTSRALIIESEITMASLTGNAGAVRTIIEYMTVLGASDTTRKPIFESETAMLAIAESDVAAPIAAAHKALMTYMVSNAPAMATVVRSRKFLLAVTEHTSTIYSIEKSTTAKTALAESPLRKTLSSVPINATWTSRRAGKVWLVSFKHTLSTGTGNHLHGYRLYDGSQTTTARADAYNTALRMDCFMDSISNQTSAAAVNTNACEYVYIPLE